MTLETENRAVFMKIPGVSVILPVYNSVRYIEDAVRSILCQTMNDFELLLLDDGSVDGTEELVRQLAAQDERIHLVQRENRGLIATLNEGLALARSPLIARMDADDIALPHRLARQYDYMQRHPDVVAVGSDVRFMDEQGRCYRTKKVPVGEAVEDAWRWGCPLVHPTVMMRAEAVRRAGGYSSAFPSAEDYALWLRLLAFGVVDNIPEVLLQYRVHGESISHTSARQQRNSILRAQAIWLTGSHWEHADSSIVDPLAFLASLGMDEEEQRELLARMRALCPHLIGILPEQDPEAQSWDAIIRQGCVTSDIRTARALYHLRAARRAHMLGKACHLLKSVAAAPEIVALKVMELILGRWHRSR